MNKVRTLVLMQLRDKMNLNWTKSTKDIIHKVGMSLIKFILLVAANSVVLYLLSYLKLVYYSDMPSIMTFMLTLVLFLNICSCTVGLTKTLYFSEDNKVLITFPVGNNKIFISKLLVFLFYEIKRSFTFTIPIILGCVINIYLKGALSPWSFLWMILPIFLFISLPVLIGALLSIPAMYIYIFCTKHSWMKFIFLVLGLTLYVFAFLSIVKYLPDKIDMNTQFGPLSLSIRTFLQNFEKYNYPIAQITRIITGEATSLRVLTVTWTTVLKFTVLLASCVVLFLGCYFISRPIFFKMMSKNFEFNKVDAKAKKNKKHSKLLAFNLKDMKVTFRSLEISLNYAVTYVTIPILIYILDQLFIAMNKDTVGINITYTFNVLLVIFPLLLSNGMIATLYSKEGRAGYIKKTKPVNPLMPLISKLAFNLIISVPCVVASMAIFYSYTNACHASDPELCSIFGIGNMVMLTIALILVNYAHIFLCARNDIMNPQNEVYATSGNDANNINESRGTAAGIAISIIYSLFTYILFVEGATETAKVTVICVKLLCLALLIFGYFFVNFILSVKTSYAPNKDYEL